MTKPPAADTIASKTLAEHGIAAIWDFQVAAAAAYGLGQFAVAASLVEIADAAEQELRHLCEAEARAG